MTTRQTRFGGNQCWQNKIYFFSCEGEGGVGFPVVTTDGLTMHGASDHANVDGTVVSEGASTLTAYGLVWSTTSPPTISDHFVSLGAGPFTGAFNADTGFTLPVGQLIYFAAFATNAQGTSYGAILTGTVIPCLASDTLITLANGKKKQIIDISYNDELLVWNFDEGKFDSAKPLWMLTPFTINNHELIKFSDGSSLKVVADKRGHRIYNFNQDKFTYSISDSPFGTRTFTEDNRNPHLVSKEVVEAKTTFCNIITGQHINVFANGILTSTGLNHLYPIRDMKFIKEPRMLRSNEFGVSDEMYHGLRLAEQVEDVAEKVRALEAVQLKKS